MVHWRKNRVIRLARVHLPAAGAAASAEGDIAVIRAPLAAEARKDLLEFFPFFSMLFLSCKSYLKDWANLFI